MSVLTLFHSYLPSPVIFSWGPLVFHWYGVLITLAVMVGYFVVRRRWRREQNGKISELDELFFWLLLAGLVGARLLDVFLFEWWYFRAHLIEMLYFWDGGLSFHGALLGGLAVLWWRYRHSSPALRWTLDLLAPALALGQAIGRWGNYFNQELFGLPTNLPWGIPITESFRPADFDYATYFHPVFLYEFLGLLLLAWWLWRLGRCHLAAGSVFAVYLVVAGLLRLILEFIRLDEQLVIGGIRSGMWMAGLMVIVGMVLWTVARRRSVTAA